MFALILLTMKCTIFCQFPVVCKKLYLFYIKPPGKNISLKFSRRIIENT